MTSRICSATPHKPREWVEKRERINAANVFDLEGLKFGSTITESQFILLRALWTPYVFRPKSKQSKMYDWISADYSKLAKRLLEKESGPAYG